MAFTRAQMMAIQKALNGWWEVRPQLVPDGIWGANTARGVRQFQQRVGLPVTGQLNAATLQRLGVPNVGASAGVNMGGSIGASAGVNMGGSIGASASIKTGGNNSGGALVFLKDAFGPVTGLPSATPVMVADVAGKMVATTAGAAVDMAKAAGTSLVLSVDAAGNRVARIGGSMEEILKAYAAPFGAMFGLSLPVVGLAAAVLLVLMLKRE